MRKLSITLALIISLLNLVAQPGHSTTFLVRQDTTLLKAEECNWLIQSISSNKPPASKNNQQSVSQIILDAIKNGTLKAIDVETKQQIPANKIFTWQMPTDTIMEYDDAGNTKYRVVQIIRTADKVSRIRIYQDLYFNSATKKLQPSIKYIELLEELYTSSGVLIGYKPFCRINY